MSFVALAAAAEHVRANKLKPSSIAVLFMLANRHNQLTGQCNPSVPTIAEDTGLSVRGVREALRELEQKRLIKTKPRKANNDDPHPNKSNLYTIKSVAVKSTLPPANSAVPPRQILPGKQEYTAAVVPTANDAVILPVNDWCDLPDPDRKTGGRSDG